MATHFRIPAESHGQRSPAGYSPWGHKELDITEVAKEKQNIRSSLFYILYHYRLLNVIPVLMEGPCWLSCSCLSQSETPNLSQAPLFGNHKFIFYVSKSASVL